jgi:uncharacterized membrane protein (UPF0127 family)
LNKAVQNVKGGEDLLNRKYYVFNENRQSFLHLGVERADSSLSRLRGLLGRWSLRSDEGLWVIPSRGIHTIGLFFPIDVVYLDAAGQVVHLVENLKPFRITSLRRRCDSVLELPTRSIYNSHTQIGDRLVILTQEEMQSHLADVGHRARPLRSEIHSDEADTSRVS